MGVEKIDAAASGNGDQRIGFGGFAHRFQRLQMHAGERADDLKMAEFFGADIHQQVFAAGIFAVKTLDGILHRRGKLAVGAAELFQKHIAETRIGLVNADGVHKFLDMMIHCIAFFAGEDNCVSVHPRSTMTAWRN